MNDQSYAGDITPTEAWEWLNNQQSPDGTYLIDVRTRAEWAYVGVPDTRGLGTPPIFIPWQNEANIGNDGFMEELIAHVPNQNSRILFLCRSGGRSKMAAICATAHHYKNCYNIAGGFEGDLNPELHRGGVNGWKKDGLPWVQS